MISSLIINQTPAILNLNPKQKASLECHHGDNNYPYMLWYQYKSDGQRVMDLIGLLHYENPNLEKKFEARFNISGHSKGKAQLVISAVTTADTAEYFCAAS